MDYDHPIRQAVRQELFLGQSGESIYVDEEFWARLIKIIVDKARDHEFDTAG